MRDLLSAERHTRDVTAELAARWGLPRRDVYALAQRLENSGQQTPAVGSMMRAP